MDMEPLRWGLWLVLRLYKGQRVISPIWVGFGSFSSLSLGCFGSFTDFDSSGLPSWDEGGKHMTTEMRMSSLVSVVRYPFASLWVYGLTREKLELDKEAGLDETLNRKSMD